ncbi:hypothetical protein [Maritalea sp.]|uniref:hypothetical protein n=1 Tax=Maritalea sp. TaxID=2003361 RepID=UPI003F4AB935
MKRLFLTLAILAGLVPGVASAQDMSGVPDVSMFKMMVDANKQAGWVAFREYDGQQLIYFTALVTSRCRLKEIRYSVNSDALDQQFALAPCIPDAPFSIPSDAGLEAIAISLPSQTAKTVSVQVVFKDDVETEMMTYRPCVGVGDGTCAKAVN